jgi:hypothetical protein
MFFLQPSDVEELAEGGRLKAEGKSNPLFLYLSFGIIFV